MTIDNSFSSDINVKEILEQYLKRVQQIAKIEPTTCNTTNPSREEYYVIEYTQSI